LVSPLPALSVELLLAARLMSPPSALAAEPLLAAR